MIGMMNTLFSFVLDCWPSHVTPWFVFAFTVEVLYSLCLACKRYKIEALSVTHDVILNPLLFLVLFCFWCETTALVKLEPWLSFMWLYLPRATISYQILCCLLSISKTHSLPSENTEVRGDIKLLVEEQAWYVCILPPCGQYWSWHNQGL